MAYGRSGVNTGVTELQIDYGMKRLCSQENSIDFVSGERQTTVKCSVNWKIQKKQ